MAACNGSIQKYSLLDPVFSDPSLTQIPMAVIGIVMKFFQIVISIVVGMAAGCAPVAAYNIGAKRNGRVRDLCSSSLDLSTSTAAVLKIKTLDIFKKSDYNVRATCGHKLRKSS